MTAESANNKRTLLAVLAFIAGGAVPIQLVTLSFGYAQYVRGIPKGPELLPTAHAFAEWYVPLVYLPALALLAGIALYSRRRWPDLTRRIVVGLAAGAIGTLALDAARQAGVIHGWLPGDTPVMFGKLVAGPEASFALFYPVGLFVHYLNGANFGLFYAFVWGKRGSYRSAALWGTVWLLIVELGMMTLPPMGPMTGLFGTEFSWPGLFLVTLVAHVLTGLTVGLLTELWLTDEDRGWLLPFLFGRSGTSPGTAGKTSTTATTGVE
jgi:hypothetical protein